MQVCTSLQADNHASTPPLSFLQAGCPYCRPTDSVKALKAITENENQKKNWPQVQCLGYLFIIIYLTFANIDSKNI